jgi:hypothetical protein
MSDLTSQVLQHLDSSGIEAIAARLGVDPAQAEAAVRQAVPLVVGGLARTASTDDGAAAVHETATAHAGTDLGSLLGGLLGGNGGGGAILGQIFGTRQDQASQGLGQASGLGTQNAGQLLAMLAPIVMSVLGNMSQKQNLDPGSLGGALSGELGRIGQSGQGGLLTSVLDQDGDGKLGLGDLLKMGTNMLGARNRA